MFKAKQTARGEVSGFETALSPRHRRYLRWVFEAKKRFGLSVLNFMVPSIG